MITEQEVKSKTPEIFWSKIKLDEPDKCWIWQRSCFEWGYGQFGIPHGKGTTAHRYIYIQVFGDLPSDVIVCHKCDNPPCCNPNHLFAGTDKRNSEDMVEKGRQAKGSKIGTSKLKEHQIEEIKLRLAANETQLSIAKAYKVSRTLIGLIKQGRRWLYNQHPDIKMPERQGYQKLAIDQVREIKIRLSNGEKTTRLAEEFNLKQPTISNIKTGKTWKHVQI